MLVTAGQAGDSPQFTAVLAGIRAPRHGSGRARTRPDRVPADKAYSSRGTGLNCAGVTSGRLSTSPRIRPATGHFVVRRAVDHPPSTPRPTSSATPWNAASTDSSGTEPSPLATTSSPCATSPPSASPLSASGSDDFPHTPWSVHFNSRLGHPTLRPVDPARRRSKRRSDRPVVLSRHCRSAGTVRHPSSMGRFMRLHMLRVALATMAYALVAASVLGAQATGGLAGPERGTIDLRYRVRGPQPPDPSVLVVAVDDRTIGAVDQVPPIPRRYYAQALDRLRAGGARLIVVDVQFSGAGPSRADDDALVASITRNGPVVLMAPDFGEPSSSVPAGRPGTAGAVLAAAGVDPDPDGVLRTMLYRQVDLPTLPVRAAQMLTGGDVDDGFNRNHAPIDFRGGPGTFPTVSMIDLIDGAVPPARITGKTVLIGVTAPAQKDVFLTSASRTPLSGVEVHANALQTLLNGVPLRPVPPAVDVIVLLVLAALPLLLLAMGLSSPKVLPLALLILVVLAVALQGVFDHGWIVAEVPAGAALLLATAAAVALDAGLERHRRRNIEFPFRDAAYFLSYRRNQSAYAADSLRHAMTKRYGKDTVFLDTARIGAGQRWPDEIHGAVRACQVMLVLISPQWQDARTADGRRRLQDPADWVRIEVGSALRQPGTIVIPMLLEGASMPTELPEDLADLARLQAFHLDGAIDRYLDELEEHIQRAWVAKNPKGEAIDEGIFSKRRVGRLGSRLGRGLRQG
jgi:CHASE2 domain-containing sensor protein